VADSPLKRLLVQTSHYGLASLFTMVAGLVTFPLLTRSFTVADYGLMSLISATLTICVAVGKVGMQHSIVRYRSEIGAGKSRFTLAQLYSTTTFGMIATGLVVAVCLVLGVQIVPEKWLADPRLRGLFAVAGFLVAVQVVESALINFLRAEQQTAALMKYQVIKKYASLAAIVVAILLISRTLISFYSATLLSEGLAVILLAAVLFRGGERPRPRANQFSRPLYFELLGFGVPMMIGYEMSGIVLSVGDRYVIEAMIGESQLGLYAAAYNLCMYIQGVLIASIGQAIMPIYMQMFDEKGPEQTSAFISQSLRRYVFFGAPVIGGLAAVGPELLPSLASDKYVTAGAVLPWVIAGMVVDGSNAMLGAGLFVHRKTRTIMAIVIACALLNIGLNIVLIPHFGVVGSAMSTLVSYTVTSLLMATAGERLLRVKLPWGMLLRAGVASFAMYWAVIYVLPGQRLITVGVRAFFGAVVYGAIMLVIDKEARLLANKILERLGRRK
jgi:O-antigen/teichoic acid export membrane protein